MPFLFQTPLYEYNQFQPSMPGIPLRNGTMEDENLEKLFANKQTLPPGPGVLLVATLKITQSIFRQSIVLLCEHNDKGSFGLILNVPTQVQIGNIDPNLALFDQKLHQGGPVQIETFHFIHEDTAVELGSREIFPSVFWGQDYERLLAYSREYKGQQGTFKFFAGYAGWAAGQLAHEIKHKSWFLTPATPDIVFYPDSDKHWAHTLRSMGPEFGLIADMA